MESSTGPRAIFMAFGTKGDVFPIAIGFTGLRDSSGWGVAPESLQKEHLVPDSEDARSIKQAADALSAAIKHALSPEMRDQASRVSERISSEMKLAAGKIHTFT